MRNTRFLILALTAVLLFSGVSLAANTDKGAASDTGAKSGPVGKDPKQTACKNRPEIAADSRYAAAVALLDCRHALDRLGEQLAMGGTVNRGLFALVIQRAFELDLFTPTVASFTDVSPSSPYYAAVETLVQHRVMSGLSSSQCANMALAYPCFGLNLSTSRADTAMALKAAAALPDATPLSTSFIDVPPSSYAYVPVESITARRIMSGSACTGGNCFYPSSRVAVGDMILAIYMAIIVSGR